MPACAAAARTRWETGLLPPADDPGQAAAAPPPAPARRSGLSWPLLTAIVVADQIAKAIVRAKLWDANAQVDRKSLPSTGTIIAELSGGKRISCILIRPPFWRIRFLQIATATTFFDGDPSHEKRQ